ncbi:MAG: dipeptidase, partial [Thermoplasmatota archaeon]
MGLKNRKEEYNSYGFLKEGEDFKKFVFPNKMNIGEPYEVSLSKSEEERLIKLLKDNVYISLHEHPTVAPEDMSKFLDYVYHGREWTPYDWLSSCYYDAIFDNFKDGTSMITSKSGWKWNDIIYDLGHRFADIAHQDFVFIGQSIEDIEKAHNEGRIALIPALESCTPIENEVDRLDILYGMGVRMMGVVYSESNNLGTGLKEEKDGGLTYFGQAAVERMNKLGMAIDVSHASDQTCLDTFETSSDPIFITHAGARSLWESNRLKPDDVLKACVEDKGVIGIEAAPHTTVTKEHPKHSIESFMEHFEYIVDMVGIDYVSFGPDTLYGDHVALHDFFASNLSTDSSTTKKGSKPKKVRYVKGLENPTEASHNIIRWLIKNGYSNKEIEKVIGGNTLRALERIW